MEMFVFTGIIWEEDGCFSSLCPELDVASQGNTQNDARKNLMDAAELQIQGSIEDGLPYLRPVPPSEDPRNFIPSETIQVFKFKVDVEIRVHA